MKKKSPRKAKSSGDDEAVEFLIRLREYYDYERYDSRTFPSNIPQNFPLKIGKKIVGKAFVDWTGVFTMLLSASMSLAKPEGVTDEDHAQGVKELIDAASPE